MLSASWHQQLGLHAPCLRLWGSGMSLQVGQEAEEQFNFSKTSRAARLLPILPKAGSRMQPDSERCPEEESQNLRRSAW